MALDDRDRELAAEVAQRSLEERGFAGARRADLVDGQLADLQNDAGDPGPFGALGDVLHHLLRSPELVHVSRPRCPAESPQTVSEGPRSHKAEICYRHDTGWGGHIANHSVTIPPVCPAVEMIEEVVARLQSEASQTNDE